MQIYPSDTQSSLFMELISGKPLPRSQCDLSRCPAVHPSICPSVQLLSWVNTTLEWVRTQLYRVRYLGLQTRQTGSLSARQLPLLPLPPLHLRLMEWVSEWMSEWASDWLTDGLTGLPVCRPRRCEISATEIPYAIVLHINQSAAAKSLSPDWHFLATFGFGFFRFLFLMRVRYGKIVNWIELISKAKTAQLKPHETVARPHRLAFLGPGQNHFPYCSSGG